MEYIDLFNRNETQYILFWSTQQIHSIELKNNYDIQQFQMDPNKVCYPLY